MIKKISSFLMFQCFLSPGCRRWDQWQQCRVCGVFVGCARHTHPAVQTPVSLQRLRRHSALPGQLLPHLQTAWVPIHNEECLFKIKHPAVKVVSTHEKKIVETDESCLQRTHNTADSLLIFILFSYIRKSIMLTVQIQENVIRLRCVPLNMNI